MQIRETAVRCGKFKDNRLPDEKGENEKCERVEDRWKNLFFVRFSRARRTIKGSKCSKSEPNQHENPIWPSSCYWNGIRSCLLCRVCSSPVDKRVSQPADNFLETRGTEKERGKENVASRYGKGCARFVHDDLFSKPCSSTTLSAKQAALIANKPWRTEGGGIFRTSA